jgi:hypothetical protein
MIGITLSWRLRPLGHLTGLNRVDSMGKSRFAAVMLLLQQTQAERIKWAMRS